MSGDCDICGEYEHVEEDCPHKQEGNIMKFIKSIGFQRRAPLSKAASLLEGKSDLLFYGFTVGQIGIGVIVKVKSEAK